MTGQPSFARGSFLAGALLLACGPSAAAPNASDPFNQLDHDNDGNISYSEAKADPALGEDFNRLDDDKNGELDRGEFAQFEARGLTNTPDILPPEPPAKVDKAPPLPPRDRNLSPSPPAPAPR